MSSIACPKATPQPCHFTAWAFLSVFAPGTDRFTFYTYDDVRLPDGRKRGLPELRRTFHGTLGEHWGELCRLNAMGASVCYVVNETDLIGRKSENMMRARAQWFEDDDGASSSLAFLLPPSITVHTSPGKRHLLWVLDGDMSRADSEGVQRTMVDLGSDKNAADFTRGLRLPGFIHRKDPSSPHLVTFDAASSPRHTAERVLQAFRPTVVAKPAPSATAAPSPDWPREHAWVADALKYVSAADYDTWLKVGMALHFGSGGCQDGFDLWSEWSEARADGAVYDPDALPHRWDGFGRDHGPKVTLGTIAKLARDAGWKGTPPRRDDPREGFGAVAGPLAQAVAADPLSALWCEDDIDLDAIEAQDAAAIIEGIFYPGEVTQLYGDSTSGKTFAAMDMCWHVAQGKRWRGRRVTRSVVVYVSLEGERGFKVRVEGLKREMGPTDGFFRFLRMPVSLAKGADGKAGADLLIATFNALKNKYAVASGLIVIDTFARAVAGDDENSSADMMAFVQLRQSYIAAETGANVIVVDHTNGDGKARGNKLRFGAQDIVLRVERDEEANPTSGTVRKLDTRHLVLEKVKDGRDGDRLGYKLREVELRPARGERRAITTCVVEPLAEPMPDNLALRNEILRKIEDREAEGKPISASPRGDKGLGYCLAGGDPEKKKTVENSADQMERQGIIRRDENNRWLRVEGQEIWAQPAEKAAQKGGGCQRARSRRGRGRRGRT